MSSVNCQEFVAQKLGLMGEKGLMEEDWNDRSKWR
jgi:hypothetical protein